MKVKPCNRALLMIAIGWQVVVFAFAVAGFFVEVFALLGISWNSTGRLNLTGTVAGLVLLELPLGLFLLHAYRRRKKNSTQCVFRAKGPS
jgi:hypothetical protein